MHKLHMYHGVALLREHSLFMVGGWGDLEWGGGEILRPIVVGGGDFFFSILFWRGDFFSTLFLRTFFHEEFLHVLLV